MVVDLLPPDRPRINVSGQDVQAVSDQCWTAINEPTDPPRNFSYCGSPVRLVFRPDGGVALQSHTVDTLIHEITQKADCYGFNRKGEEIPKFLPKEIARNMLAAPNPPLPVLKHVVRTPVFTPDGKLIAIPGFDAKSGIYYIPIPGSGLEGIVKRIDTNKLQERVEFLRYVLSDFPFVTVADFAHCLSVALLPLVRPMIEGQTPIKAVTKKCAGEGASLLLSVLVYPALGFHVPRTSAPSDEAEWNRTLQAVLSGMPQAVLIDNVSEGLRSGALASAVTAPSIAGRKIRTGEAPTIPANCVWLATGIDITMSPELARRTILIHLDSGQDHPELRNDFKIPNLEVWVRQNRAEMLVALLTIIQAWIEEGCPRSGKVLGGFEEYSAIMGGILENAGVTGFLEGMVRPPVVGQQPDESAWINFIAEWCGAHGLDPVASRDLVVCARKSGLLPPSGTATQLGRILAKRVGTNTEGLTIEAATPLNGTNRWRLK